MHTYPWTAVVGQPALRCALALCAIDPSIGGVLVKGPRGVGKTTLARALACVFSGNFVELPLGASEERVTGTLDLARALSEREVQFSPGLLARAHGGVLYVDEVNLLPDPLVDLLLDAAASGQNVVERDGISHRHPARFALIGTMNPEEGELRPQLSDRFGLCVSAEEPRSAEERREIVARRLAFDAAPARFVEGYAAAEADLSMRCAVARERVAEMALEGPLLDWVAERCHGAGIEGVRADLAMARAARAHAAWQGRSTITPEDVACVAELALSHRRRPGRMQTRPPSGGGPPTGSRGGESQARGSGTASGSPGPSSAALSKPMVAVPVPFGPKASIPPELVGPVGGRAARQHGRGTRAASSGRVAAAGRGTRVDWFLTLSRGVPQTRADLCYRLLRAPERASWLLLIDGSASMLRHGALAAAKSVALALLGEARRAGALVQVWSFREGRVEPMVDGSHRPEARARALHTLGGVGTTSLAHALEQALLHCARASRRDSARLYVLTDGRSSERVEARAPRGSAVIDCEQAPVRLGRAAALASQLGALYVPVGTLMQA